MFLLYKTYPTISSGEKLNMFKESGTKLLTCTNYLLDIVPEKGDNWSCVSDFLFTLASSANDNPACITVKFDDIYIVNQVTFIGYCDPSRTENERTPFCYQVRGPTLTYMTLYMYIQYSMYTSTCTFCASTTVPPIGISCERYKESLAGLPHCVIPVCIYIVAAKPRQMQGPIHACLGFAATIYPHWNYPM